VTVLPGHGIGPELMRAAMAVLKATGAPLAFEVRHRAAAAASRRAPASPAVSRAVCLLSRFSRGVRGGLGLFCRHSPLLFNFYIFSSAAARAGD
jgi:isocitrate/isopropylmalate dehydrogenase